MPLPLLAGQLGTDEFGSQLNMPGGGSNLGGQQLTGLFKPEEVKSIVQSNKIVIQNKLSERRKVFFKNWQRVEQYQDKFRTYSILASRGRLEIPDAVSLLNQEFPEQQKTTLETMNELFP